MCSRNQKILCGQKTEEANTWINEGWTCLATRADILLLHPHLTPTRGHCHFRESRVDKCETDQINASVGVTPGEQQNGNKVNIVTKFKSISNFAKRTQREWTRRATKHGENWMKCNEYKSKGIIYSMCSLRIWSISRTMTWHEHDHRLRLHHVHIALQCIAPRPLHHQYLSLTVDQGAAHSAAHN